MARKAALSRFLVILGGYLLSFGAIGCPDGDECANPTVTQWCYWIDNGPTGACPFTREADAKAYALNLAQSVRPLCNYQAVQDITGWDQVIGCYPGSPGYSNCFIHTDEQKYAFLTVSNPDSPYCVLEDGANMARHRLATCPAGFVTDSATGLCVRSRVKCPYCIGDPFVPTSLELVESETDYLGGGPFPLELKRYYRSYPTDINESYPNQSANLGSPWRHNYQRKIAIYSTAPTVAWAVRPGDNTHYFDLTNGSWVGRHDESDRLVQQIDAQGKLTGWVYTTASDETEIYNASGQLTQVTSRAGLTHTLNYDTQGRLISVADAFGRQLTFSYSNALVSQVDDPSGNVYAYTYNVFAGGVYADLATVKWPDGAVRTFLYNEPAFIQAGVTHGFMTGIVDENGSRYSTFQYDSSARVIATGHSGGADTWSANFAASAFTDPLGVGRTFYSATVAGAIRPKGISLPCPHCGAIPASISYDANGNVSSTTDFNGVQTRRTYDLVRNLEIARMEGVGACPANTTFSTTLYGASCAVGICMTTLWFPGSAPLPGLGGWFYVCASTAARTTSTQWHAVWRQPTKIAEPNRITTFTYNGDGGVYCAPTTALVNGHPIGVLCKKSVQATTDATGAQAFSAVVTGAARTSTYTYDAYGQVLTAKDPNGRITTTTYYLATDPDIGKRGNVATITNPLGHVTTYTAYDLNGRPTSITDPNGMVTSLTYSPRGWLTSRTVGGESTTYTYDAVGQLIKVLQPDGSYVQYTYDAAHRLIGLQDALGNRIAYTLDGVGNRTKEDVFDPSGALTRRQQHVYDVLNRLHQNIGAR